MIADAIFQSIFEYRWTRRALFALLVVAHWYADKVDIVVVLLVLALVFEGMEFLFKRWSAK